MTNEEIIKGIKLCNGGQYCDKCPFANVKPKKNRTCCEQLMLEAGKLIAKQEERLTAYEETGLTPGDVHSLWGEWNAMMSVLNSIGGYDRLRELAEADKDGRLVVRPCKAGDTLFRVFAGEILEYKVGKMIYLAIQERWDIDTIPFCPYVESSIGETIFLTREEAEAALKEVQNG